MPFVKYTSCGNNFVILDELDGNLFDEAAWPAVAHQVTSPYFGVGCDNLLVLQPATREKMRAIRDARGYWSQVPEVGDANMLFRMFEPDGTEAFCCGNGLMCIARYLSDRRGIQRARILTEIPLPRPQALTLGTLDRLDRSWVTLGDPRATPSSLVDRSALQRGDHDLELLPDLQIKLREHDLSPFSDAHDLRFDGYLVFTGEPHLVVFPEESLCPGEVAGTLFSSSVPHLTDTSGACRRVNFGTTVLRRIGQHLNRRFAHLFPAGVSVNVARVDNDNGYIEYRCFERGINRETLACGTGALAVTYAVWARGMMGGETFTIRPHRCRWYEPEAVIGVTRRADSGWTLDASPRLICNGEMAASARFVDSDDEVLKATSAEAESEDATGDEPDAQAAAA